MHQYSVFNGVYYPKERKNYTINENHSDSRHVTIAQHFGGGVHVWLMIAYNVALFYYCKYSVRKWMYIIMIYYISILITY